MPEDHEKHCFVIGPLGDEGSPERIHADWLLEEIIRPVFKNDRPDWVVERSDKIATPGMISAQIVNRLHDAGLVVADLSFHNANAFYEMSIRHKVGRPIIHMIRKGEKIPFDVIPHRAIQFELLRPSDLQEARDQLSLAVAEALKPGFEPDNPITHARGKAKLEEHATPEMKVLANELAALTRRIDDMEARIWTPPPPSFGNFLSTSRLHTINASAPSQPNAGPSGYAGTAPQTVGGLNGPAAPAPLRPTE